MSENRVQVYQRRVVISTSIPCELKLTTMAATDEILDVAAYVKMEVKKIAGVQILEQLVGANQIKRDRAEYVKKK